MKNPKLREPDVIQRLWPPGEQPMARLFAVGAAALTDAEVLSVLLRKGSKERSAVELARDAIAQAGGIAALFANYENGVVGLPPEAMARLYAAQELVSRALLEKLTQRSSLSSPQVVRDYLRLRLQNRPHEIFVGVFLDAQNRVLAVEDLFSGTLTQTSVYPREVVKRALFHNAAALIFAHNHPSGVAEPSRADETLTATLKRALALVDVNVLDHFVVGADSTVSFAERGLL